MLLRKTTSLSPCVDYNMRRPHQGFHEMTLDKVYRSTLANLKDAI
jgi:hypothetical protein